MVSTSDKYFISDRKFAPVNSSISMPERQDKIWIVFSSLNAIYLIKFTSARVLQNNAVWYVTKAKVHRCLLNTYDY